MLTEECIGMECMFPFCSLLFEIFWWIFYDLHRGYTFNEPSSAHNVTVFHC